jgi:hypothetical protein
MTGAVCLCEGPDVNDTSRFCRPLIFIPPLAFLSADSCAELLVEGAAGFDDQTRMPELRGA